MAQVNTVEAYWTGVASRLQVEADIFNQLVEHNGEIGRANELALSQLLISLLPTSVGVGTGVIIDSYGERSAQTDVIIYDKSTQPQIMAQSTQLLFPIETVLLAIEVKTTADNQAISDTARKVKRLRALKRADGAKGPSFAFFGYTASSAPSARAKALNDLPAAEAPDIACVLNPGLVGDTSTGSLSVALVPLHRLDDDGARISGTWLEGKKEWGQQTAIGGSMYPVSRFLPNATDLYVFEPGRALLLFCEMLLDVLAEAGYSNAAWLADYLPNIARETVPAPTA